MKRTEVTPLPVPKTLHEKWLEVEAMLMSLKVDALTLKAFQDTFYAGASALMIIDRYVFDDICLGTGQAEILKAAITEVSEYGRMRRAEDEALDAQ